MIESSQTTLICNLYRLLYIYIDYYNLQYSNLMRFPQTNNLLWKVTFLQVLIFANQKRWTNWYIFREQRILQYFSGFYYPEFKWIKETWHAGIFRNWKTFKQKLQAYKLPWIAFFSIY